MLYHVTVDGRTFEVNLAADGIFVDGTQVDADIAHLEGTEVRSLIVDGASHRIVARRPAAGLWDLRVAGSRFEVTVVDERAQAIREMAGPGAGPPGPRHVRAPMPGLVVRVEVEEGAVVGPGQGVLIVEAMKMENELRAEGAGTVSRVLVSEGDTVEKDEVLIELAPLGEDETPHG